MRVYVCLMLFCLGVGNFVPAFSYVDDVALDDRVGGEVEAIPGEEVAYAKCAEKTTGSGGCSDCVTVGGNAPSASKCEAAYSNELCETVHAGAYRYDGMCGTSNEPCEGTAKVWAGATSCDNGPFNTTQCGKTWTKAHSKKGDPVDCP